MTITLAGCGVRLERDAPGIPGLRTAAPPPDSAALLATLGDVRRLERVAAASAGWGPRLAAVHRAQEDRISDVVAGLGVRPSSSPSSTRADGGAVGDLAGAEMTFATGAAPADLARTTAAHLPMLAAVAATRGAAATLAGHSPTWPNVTMPPAAVCVALLAAVRPAVYGVEVVAAGVRANAERKAMRSLLKGLYADRSRLEAAAGTAAPPPPLSYPLPPTASTPQARRQVVAGLLAPVVTATAAQVIQVRGEAAPLTGLLDLWSGAVARAWSWGVPPTPFPGLSG
ncbi:hypothetical protein [Luteipulveratus flavus]|uniref:DUF4439 domain-containing protein n=1 Tax=Luteipulveratus flavus TaxID=3031728 RepID=A0ABT6C7N1_9MICO|nr:hypothetical protein [Luteipulveratus sp. YIM 133296]MDF8263291.1 hypothetical protein [Luteipulveratus sp. YIM 133296]